MPFQVCRVCNIHDMRNLANKHEDNVREGMRHNDCIDGCSSAGCVHEETQKIELRLWLECNLWELMFLTLILWHIVASSCLNYSKDFEYCSSSFNSFLSFLDNSCCLASSSASVNLETVSQASSVSSVKRRFLNCSHRAFSF